MLKEIEELVKVIKHMEAEAGQYVTREEELVATVEEMKEEAVSLRQKLENAEFSLQQTVRAKEQAQKRS